MHRRHALTLLAAAGGLAACAPGGTGGPTLGPDGLPLPRLYRISRAERGRIPGRALDAVNALRAEAGAGPVALNGDLTEAAQAHSRDMSLQNRPWHFGSDGSSPLDRARRAGFRGRLLGEAVSETYESELETILAWGQDPGPRRVLLDREADSMGFAFFQEDNGKIWWTLTMGAAGAVA